MMLASRLIHNDCICIVETRVFFECKHFQFSKFLLNAYNFMVAELHVFLSLSSVGVVRLFVRHSHQAFAGGHLVVFLQGIGPCSVHPLFLFRKHRETCTQPVQEGALGLIAGRRYVLNYFWFRLKRRYAQEKRRLLNKRLQGNRPQISSVPLPQFRSG